jgi:hypothetical protein
MPVEQQHVAEIHSLLQDGKHELGEPEYEYWANAIVRHISVKWLVSYSLYK